MIFLILIFLSFLFSNEKFIQPCKSNCSTIFFKYGFKGKYSTIEYGTTQLDSDAYISKDGSFLGYDYNLLSVFKNKRGNLKLGALFSIDTIETNKVFISNPLTEISPFYKGHAFYWQIEYAFFNRFHFWIRNYFKNNSDNDNLISYLAPAFSSGIALKLYDKYFIGYDISRYGIRTNDGLVSFHNFIIQSISLGYQF